MARSTSNRLRAVLAHVHAKQLSVTGGRTQQLSTASASGGGGVSLAEPMTFGRGPPMKNRFMLAPLTNEQSGEDGVLSDDEYHWLVKRAEGVCKSPSRPPTDLLIQN